MALPVIIPALSAITPAVSAIIPALSAVLPAPPLGLPVIPSVLTVIPVVYPAALAVPSSPPKYEHHSPAAEGGSSPAMNHGLTIVQRPVLLGKAGKSQKSHAQDQKQDLRKTLYHMSSYTRVRLTRVRPIPRPLGLMTFKARDTHPGQEINKALYNKKL